MTLSGHRLFFIFLISITMQGLMSAQSFKTGEYHLTGVREMAAAFLFTPEGRFEFFYSYGASDRVAAGSYAVEGDTLKLQSDKEAGKDFTIIAQRKDKRGYTVQITDQNAYMASSVLCAYRTGETWHQLQSDDKGMIQIPDKTVDEIYVQHLLFPDAMNLIKGVENENTFFELTLNPSLQQVSFKGIDFVIKDNAISCLPNYFMPMENIVFSRVGE